MGIRRGLVLVAVATLAFATAAVRAGASSRPPLDVALRFSATALDWSLAAHADVAIVAVRWRTRPASLLAGAPAWQPLSLSKGTAQHGRVACDPPPGAWVEVQIEARGPHGAFTTGASTRRPLVTVRGGRTALAVDRPRATTPGVVQGRFLYEDRLVDARGYTGRTQRLPLRHVAAELIDEASGTILGRTHLDADGAFRFETTPASGTASVRVWSWTLDHPRYALRVVQPAPDSAGEDAPAVPHALQTSAFALDARGVDLGTLVERDADGYGVVQAFHILDLAIDAFDAVGSADFPGPRPGRDDGLRIFWGPELRIRFSAQGRDVIEITSPGSGDTDGWSDTIVLHEVGHYIAQRFLREANPGGIHLLGDVEQNLQLAWAEGLATAFACWVRQHRADHRRNADGLPLDADVARYVNVGLPPPDDMAGGLQFEWDVEAHRLGRLDLARDGIGSETTIAGLLWDVVDDAGSADAGGGDDDAIAVSPARVWSALRAMRELPAGSPITFEDFWVTWQEHDSEPQALDALLRDAHIDFTRDAAEPDGERAPALYAARPTTTSGGVVINEIALGALIAIEIANRDPVAADLSGWALVARANASSGAPSLTTTLPAGTRIGARGRLVVHRGGDGPFGARDVVAENWTTPWFPAFEGAVVLRDGAGRNVDFVRWNGRDGVPSTVPPPAGLQWSGDVEAAPFGRVLARVEHAPDSDRGADFVAADASLGAPNDTPNVARTFFPRHDTDVQRWEVPRAGVYTVEVRRPRNGAQPRLEVWLPDASQAITHVTARAGSRVPARVTLRLDAGVVLEARTTHTGATTRFGTYAMALYEELEVAPAVPPVGVHTAIALEGDGARVDLAWWNGGVYDAIRVRGGDGTVHELAGDARAWALRTGRGLQRIDVEAVTAGRTVAAPQLEVDVDPWPPRLREDFGPAAAAAWSLEDGWTLRDGAGRAATLAGERAAARRWRAVAITPESVLEFEHICAAAPERRATLELTADWGATWETLGEWNWNSSVAGGADWRDGRADEVDWTPARIALGAWAGRPVQLRFRIRAGNGDAWRLADLRIDDAPAAVPFVVRLHPAVPNPFNPSTRLQFELARPAAVALDIFDVRGRRCRALVASAFDSGMHVIDWDGRDDRGEPLASGVYFARVQALDGHASRKLVLLR